jgi:hypothetical protein
MNYEPTLRCEHCGRVVDPRTEFNACAHCGRNPASGVLETDRTSVDSDTGRAGAPVTTANTRARKFAARLQQNAEDYHYGRIHHDTHRHRNDATWHEVDAAGCHDEVLEILRTTPVVAAGATMTTTLAGIAKDYLGFPTLDERENGHLEVREVHVARVRRALEAAFRAGVASQ